MPNSEPVDKPVDKEEALAMVKRAQDNYIDAKQLRHDVIRLAIRTGCSYRDVAQAMSLSLGAVHNLVNGRAVR